MIDFNKEYILENDIARLTPLKETDLDVFLEYALNEPALWQYSLQSAASKSKMQAYLKTAVEKRNARHSYPFLVLDKRTGEVAGSTRFYDYQVVHQSVQLGYTWYGKRFHRTGLNRYCKLLMLNFAFDEMQMQRVEFRADATNYKSIQAMKAIGCTEEGILRSNCSSPTGRRDSIILSILRDEWYNSKKENLENLCR